MSQPDYKILSKTELNNLFLDSCRDNKLEIIKEIAPLATFQNSEINLGFLYACQKGYLEIVRYLLNSSEININAIIDKADYGAFKGACFSGNLHIVKYLLNSHEMRENIDINIPTHKEMLFFEAYEVYGQYPEIIKSFIWDGELVVDKEFKKVLKKKIKNKEHLNQILHEVERKEFLKKLKAELVKSKAIQNKQVKV